MDEPAKRCTEDSECVRLNTNISRVDYEPVMSICGSGKYLLIEMAQQGQDYSNYYNLIEIGPNSLKTKLCMELETLKAHPVAPSCLKFGGYFLKNHLIFLQQMKKARFTLNRNQEWNSLSEEYCGVFDYNLRTGRMRLIDAYECKVVFESEVED